MRGDDFPAFAKKTSPADRERMEANLRATRIAGSGPLNKSAEAAASVALAQDPNVQTCSEPADDLNPTAVPNVTRRGRKAAETCKGCFYSVNACRCAKLGFPNPIKPRRTSPELVGAGSAELRKPGQSGASIEAGRRQGRLAAIRALNELISNLEEEIATIKRVRDRLEVAP